MKSSEIKQAFFDYFNKQGHHTVSSSSLVPFNDPTLLFTNAGMVQFKETFLGQEQRSYTRAVSAQRCVRAGGKHNDLENVGYTARHHTFFEMLGNFSFGDYFKKEAIQYAWEFLTTILKLPPERLWITVYKDDDEAAAIWLNDIGVSPDRFSRCGDEDNFWMMGDTGPCGPCTEIFYDHGPDIPGGPPGSPTADGDRYIEIWNLVFMQFNRDKTGTLHPLPKPSVDTGMGLERLAAVVQGVHNNYHIDSFQYLIHAIRSMVPSNIDAEHPSLKVIADHIRSTVFLIFDGILPGNEGRSYVLRRIIRRAIRHGHQLNLPTPFFHRLVSAMVELMGEDYPELVSQRVHIAQVIEQEEHQFSQTLDQGIRLLKEQIKQVSDGKISGELAFKLYDTYGFPVDLTADIAREQQLTIDMDEFNLCMEKQRQRSQSASQFQKDYTALSVLDGVASTFRGYDCEDLESSVSTLLADQASVEELTVGMKGGVVLKETPFYAESGGQVGDRGMLIAKGVQFRVEDTKRQGKTIIHYGEVIKGTLIKNQVVHAQVDTNRRDAIRLNHTATHLLHAALKQVIGESVQQKGSLVDADRARFDFSYHEALTPQQLEEVEQLVNDQIRSNHSVETHIMSLDKAQKLGAVALFGEKYEEDVRVLSMGEFSMELCGGTHARRTGDIGLFKIISEYGVASGVRRIEMVTGQAALQWVNDQWQTLLKLSNLLKTSPTNALEKLTSFMDTLKQKDRTLAQLQQELIKQSGQSMLKDSVQTINGINLLIKRLDGQDGAALRNTLFQLKSELNDALIVLYTITDGKFSVIVGVSPSILDRVPKASEWVKHLCGKGGGRDDMAQGGGAVPDNLDEKLAQIASMLEQL